MGALTDLWSSERGLVAVALIITSTVVFLTGRITTDQWIEISKWVFTTYVAGKTASSVVALAKPAIAPRVAEVTPPTAAAPRSVEGTLSSPITVPSLKHASQP